MSERNPSVAQQPVAPTQSTLTQAQFEQPPLFQQSSTLKPHNINLTKAPLPDELLTSQIEQQQLHPVATRPAPVRWSPELRQPKQWRPKPLLIGWALILVLSGLVVALDGLWFSLSALVLYSGLVFWLVALLRQGLNLPVGRVLLPLGLLLVLIGVDLTVLNIPVIGSLLLVFGLWLLWRQFRPS